MDYTKNMHGIILDSIMYFSYEIYEKYLYQNFKGESIVE